jgi:uncharacterized protein involved in exopolysaccharide biosynthesis
MSANETAVVAEDNALNEVQIGLIDLLQVVAENLRLLLLGPLLIGILAFAYTFSMTRIYTATTKLMLPQQQASAAASLLASLGGTGGGLGGISSAFRSPIDQYIGLLKSRTVVDELIDRFKLTQRYDDVVIDDTRRSLDANVRVVLGKDGFITVEVDDTDPAFAAELANGHTEALGHVLTHLAVTEAQQRRLFFEKQLISAREKLTSAEEALKTSGVSSGTLRSDPRAAVDDVARLKAGITVLEIKLTGMHSFLAESAPEYRQAQAELAATRQQLARAQGQQPASVAGLGSGSGDYLSKYRDFKYQEALVDLFAKQYEGARVEESREGAVIQVVDAAVPPKRQSQPKNVLIALIAIVASGAALLLFVFVRYGLRGAAADPETSNKLSRLKTTLVRAFGV